MRAPTLPISISLVTSIPRQPPEQEPKLVVWDTQTGVAIGTIDTQSYGRVMFHGDQRTITFITGNEVRTYDAVSGTQLCQDVLQSQAYLILGPFWTHKDTLQFAISFKTDGKPMVNIYEIQPTLTSSLHIVSSFPIPSHNLFSFSPVSFHVSFATGEGFVILDIQDSQPLLQTRPAYMDFFHPPLFSADGCFAAYRASGNEICVWKNVSTCYVPWCSLRPQLPFDTFSWSPTSLSILCWNSDGVQILYLDNCPSIPPPYKGMPQNEKHLVAYSPDGTHIAIAREGCGDITVLNCLLDTPEQLISTQMEIRDIKISDDMIFAVDKQKLVSWNLNGDYDSKRETRIYLDFLFRSDLLRLSHDCSQIAYVKNNAIFICNIQVQETLQWTIKHLNFWDIQFPPNGDQLWLFMNGHYPNFGFYLSRLKMGDQDKWSPSVGDHLEDCWSWVNLFPSYGYHVKEGSGWVTNSRGSKVLWLPPAWRTQNWKEVKWDGKFLALLSGHHPKPIIIEFQPQPVLPHP